MTKGPSAAVVNWPCCCKVFHQIVPFVLLMSKFYFLLVPQKCVSLCLLLSALSTAFLSRMSATATEMASPAGTTTVWEGPLRRWHQERMVRCIFCMNYDDYNNLSTFGCELRRVHSCWGNFCYMRQHKRQEYFLYTSGCINLTSADLVGLRLNVAALAGENGHNKEWGNETQLCEVGQSVNTCICTNRHLCNNVTAVEPYIEYSDAIFTGIDFDELAHFRFLLPDDPILHEFERERSAVGGGNGGGYLLVKDAAIGARLANPLTILMLLLLISSSPFTVFAH